MGGIGGSMGSLAGTVGNLAKQVMGNSQNGSTGNAMPTDGTGGAPSMGIVGQGLQQTNNGMEGGSGQPQQYNGGGMVGNTIANMWKNGGLGNQQNGGISGMLQQPSTQVSNGMFNNILGQLPGNYQY